MQAYAQELSALILDGTSDDQSQSRLRQLAQEACALTGVISLYPTLRETFITSNLETGVEGERKLDPAFYKSFAVSFACHSDRLTIIFLAVVEKKCAQLGRSYAPFGRHCKCTEFTCAMWYMLLATVALSEWQCPMCCTLLSAGSR